MVVVAPPKPKKKWLVTVMGELKRGIPRLADHTVVVTVMGESNIDLRHAVIESPQIEVHTYLMMGSQTITVPKGVEVEVRGSCSWARNRSRSSTPLPVRASPASTSASSA
jgi:predicted membrane protein